MKLVKRGRTNRRFASGSRPASSRDIHAKSPSDGVGTPALERARKMEGEFARIRWAGVLLGFYEAWAGYRNPAAGPIADAGVRLATVLITCGLLGLNVFLIGFLRRHRPLDALRRAGAAAMGIDAAAVIAYIWLYSFDQTSNAWILLFLLSLEAALRYKARGALAVVAIAVPVEFYREIWRGEVFGFPIDWATQVFRVGIMSLVAGTAGIMRSALERERNQVAEQASILSEQERQLADAQAIAHVGSWTWDLVAASLMWSDELYRIFGREPGSGEVTYESYMQQVHPGDRDRLRMVIEHAVNTGSEYDIQHRIVGFGGAEKVLQCRGAVIADEHGKAVRLLGIAQDVTEAKHAEDALRRAYDHERDMVSKLQEVDKIKSAFVSSVSHELRTPLTSMLGYLELLDDERESLDTSHREILQIVDRNARRLLSLIEDLLALSRIESRQFESFPAAIELGPTVDSVKEAVLPLIGGRQLEFDIDVPTDRKVMADPEQLDRVLLNLLTNAIKFTPDGGHVTLSGRETPEHLVLQVSDTGIGIPAEEQAKLFEPFYRSSYAQSRAIPGTGLGLVITKTLIERNGGSISIDSEPGRGTTVTFTVPWAEETGGDPVHLESEASLSTVSRKTA